MSLEIKIFILCKKDNIMKEVFKGKYLGRKGSIIMSNVVGKHTHTKIQIIVSWTTIIA